MPQYYYRWNDVVYGPVSFEFLVNQAKASQLDLETIVRDRQREDWYPAGELPGLFHMAGRAEEVSRWRKERRRKETDEREEGNNTLNERQLKTISEDRPSELSSEIKAATYAATLQLRDRYELLIKPVVDHNESRVPLLCRTIRNNTYQPLKLLLSIPVVVLIPFWSRLIANTTLPKWVNESLNGFFSRRMVITAFRWGITLTIPNLIAWGIMSWSNIEAQRFPRSGTGQAPGRIFPVWGDCSSEGEYMFLLVDTMLTMGVVCYLGIRWLESKADD